MRGKAYYEDEVRVELLKTMGNMLKMERIKLGKYAKDVAVLIPCSQSVLSNFERGKVDSLFLMMRYSDILTQWQEEETNGNRH